MKPKYYKDNDPYRYALDNNLGPLEMNIIKYLTRWRTKGSPREDLNKAYLTLTRLMDEERKRGLSDENT